MATLSVIKQLLVKNCDITYNVQRLSYSNFLPKTAIQSEKYYENINSIDPNTSSNIMRSYLVYHGKKKYEIDKTSKK